MNVNEVIKGASAKIRLLDAGAVYADIIPTNLTGSITGHDNNNRGVHLPGRVVEGREGSLAK